MRPRSGERNSIGTFELGKNGPRIREPGGGAREASERMKLAIRQGSTARNMPDLIGLARGFPEYCFLVSDDVQVGELERGHVDALLREAVRLGLDPLLAMKCCTANPARHYGLDTGIIEVGASSDFVVVGDFKTVSFSLTERGKERASEVYQALREEEKKALGELNWAFNKMSTGNLVRYVYQHYLDSLLPP